ncbi:MAG: hypothetical protein HQK99_16245 [Nitrospirae bacterium]|nr:hypothetical protein [Nitrospirota bacterium]
MKNRRQFGKEYKAKYNGSTAIQDLCDHSMVLQKLRRGTEDEIFDDNESDV